MSDWIHCNKCIILLSEAKSEGISFYLTNCGHMLCEKCNPSGVSTSKCPLCASTCTIMELNAKIGPDIQAFFSDPSQMIRKQQKQTTQVLEFQTQHIKRLLQNCTKEKKRLEESNKALTKEVATLRAENQQLKRQNNTHLQTQTTRYSTPDSHGFHETPPALQVIPYSSERTNSGGSTTPTTSCFTPNRSQLFYTPDCSSPRSASPNRLNTPPGPHRYSMKHGATPRIESNSPHSNLATQSFTLPPNNLTAPQNKCRAPLLSSQNSSKNYSFANRGISSLTPGTVNLLTKTPAYCTTPPTRDTQSASTSNSINSPKSRVWNTPRGISNNYCQTNYNSKGFNATNSQNSINIRKNGL